MPAPTKPSFKDISVVVYGQGHADYIHEDLKALAQRYTVQVRLDELVPVSEPWSDRTR